MVLCGSEGPAAAQASSHGTHKDSDPSAHPLQGMGFGRRLEQPRQGNPVGKYPVSGSYSTLPPTAAPYTDPYGQGYTYGAGMMNAWQAGSAAVAAGPVASTRPPTRPDTTRNAAASEHGRPGTAPWQSGRAPLMPNGNPIGQLARAASGNTGMPSAALAESEDIWSRGNTRGTAADERAAAAAAEGLQKRLSKLASGTGLDMQTAAHNDSQSLSAAHVLACFWAQWVYELKSRASRSLKAIICRHDSLF